MTSDPMLTEYRRLGSSLVPNPAGRKGSVIKDWHTRDFSSADFLPDCNVAMIVGARSGDTVDIDLDCPEALALADIYLPPTGAVFGRASKPGSHRLYISTGAVFEAFADPLSDGKNTLLELRAQERDGGAHQTLLPPSIADGERREWEGDTIRPAPFEAAKLRRRCAYLVGLTRFGGHPEAFARGAADAKNMPTVFAGISPTDGRSGPCWP